MRVAPARRIDAPVTVVASGVVEPMQTVAVTAQVSGTLLDVLFKEGDFVQKGQRIFRIDPRPLQAVVDQAHATLTKDEAQAAARERTTSGTSARGHGVREPLAGRPDARRGAGRRGNGSSRPRRAARAPK